MTRPYALLITSFVLFHCTVPEESPVTECGNSPGNDDRTIKVSLNSKRNQTGEWVDTFTARTETGFSSNHLLLDITHRVMDCDGKRVVYIKGVTIDTLVEMNEDRIKFHPRCGKNIAISNKGFTVQRINFDDPVNSAAFTNRPLKNDELFEVILDKKIAKYSHGIGIGITTISPDVVEILPHMYSSPNAWMYLGTDVFSNNKSFLVYKAKNLNVLQNQNELHFKNEHTFKGCVPNSNAVGDRIGVMRNEFGALHFFVNGEDQGPAMSNVPQTVYGVVQLRYNDVKATIVHGKNSS